MVSPASMAMAALVVMLWILWSDPLRAKRPHPILYSVRILLFLGMTAALLFNLFRYPFMYTATTRTLTVVSALVGLIGAAYFLRKVVKR